MKLYGQHTQQLWITLSVIVFLILASISITLLLPDLKEGNSNPVETPNVNTLFYYLDEQHKITIEDIAESDDFFVNQGQSPIAFGHTTSTIWIKLGISNPTDIPDWVININNRHFTPAKIFQEQENKIVELYSIGDDNAFNTPYKPYKPEALFSVPPNQDTTIYLKLNSLKTTLLDIDILGLDEVIQNNHTQMSNALLCVGIITSLAFLNFLMFFSLRKPYLILYSLQEFVLIGLIILESGIGINEIWEGDWQFNYCLSMLLIFSLIITQTLFCQSFLSTNTKPRLHKFLNIKLCITASIIPFIFFEPTKTWILQGIAPAYFVASGIILLVVGFIRCMDKKPYGIPYFLSMLFILIFIFLILGVAMFNLGRLSLYAIDAFMLLCVSEGLMLAIAINMRIDIMKTQHNDFSTMWIETLKERLSETSEFHQMTSEKNEAVEHSLDTVKKLSTTSHDIQHSLFSIRLHLEALREIEGNERSVLRINDGLQYIEDVTQQLINEGLSNANCDGQEVIDFDDVFKCIHDQTSPFAEQKSIILGYSNTGLKHSGSTVIVRRVLENLVRNAIRHTTKGSVTLKISDNEHHLKLDVIDTGKGMNATVVNNLIQITKTDDASAIESDGYGLGLSIVSALCHQVGYRIHVESEINKGTIFSIFLPKEHAMNLQT